jgi:type I restriction enzyme M protein
MLFLKYISDQWADHYAEYQKEYGDNEERIRRKLERERFILPYVEFKDEKTGQVADRFLADFHALYERRKAANLGELINIVLDHIEEANKAKLEGVFRNIDFNSEANLGKTKDRNRRLENLLGDFAKLDLRPSRVSEDVIGDTYIYLIERFASDAGKKAGEFYTPKQVSRLLAQLAAPKPGDRICDPTCGAGGLLIEAAALVEHQGSRDFRSVRPGSKRQYLGAGPHEHVPARQGRSAHRMGRHPQQPGAGGGRPPDALQRGGRQPALQPRQVGRQGS